MSGECLKIRLSKIVKIEIVCSSSSVSEIKKSIDLIWVPKNNLKHRSEKPKKWDVPAGKRLDCDFISPCNLLKWVGAEYHWLTWCFKPFTVPLRFCWDLTERYIFFMKSEDSIISFKPLWL